MHQKLFCKLNLRFVASSNSELNQINLIFNTKQKSSSLLSPPPAPEKVLLATIAKTTADISANFQQQKHLQQ